MLRPPDDLLLFSFLGNLLSYLVVPAIQIAQSSLCQEFSHKFNCVAKWLTFHVYS